MGDRCPKIRNYMPDWLRWTNMLSGAVACLS